MAYIILGIGVGCWMYAFVNHRWNEDPWAPSAPFFWAGLITLLAGAAIILI